MIQLSAAVLLLLSPVEDPSMVLPGFIEALSEGAATEALDLVSPDALAAIDSMMTVDPDGIAEALGLFMLPVSQGDSSGDAQELLLGVFQSPAIPAMITLAQVCAGDPVETMDRVFIPVTWSVFSQSETLFVEVVSLSAVSPDWRILDFFTVDPWSLTRSSRSSCSPR